MIHLILFILTCYGLTNILMYGKILNKVRPDWELLKCSMCTGFWSGLLINCLFYYLNCAIFDNIYLGSILAGFLSSGTCYILDKTISDDGIMIKKQ